MNGATGEQIVNGAWNQGQLISKTISYTIPIPTAPAPDIVPDSCGVVVLVYKNGSPLNSNAEIQQAEQWSLISPDYVVELTSSTGDLLVENSNVGEFNAVIENQGLLDDSYYIDVEMTSPPGWTGEYTTPNGTFQFNQQDLVAVSAGNTLDVDLSVSPNAINGAAEITIQFTSMNDPNISAVATFNLVTTTGVPGLVVDASGEGYGDLLINGMDQAFDYNYGVVSNQALYPSIDLTNFTLICWSSGNALPVFTQDEINALTPFLDNGGRLLINGQDIGQDIFDASGQSQFAQSFYNNYLHANYVDDVGLTFFMRGIDGDPISLSNQFGFSLSAIYPRSPDQFIPYDAFATSLFTFGTYQQYNSLRADDGTNRVVYFGFGLEQVADQAVVDSLVVRSINWLMNGVVLNTPNEDLIAESYKLDQNYPNPFNPATTISYSIPKESNVSLIVYDIMGKQVAELVNSKQAAGSYRVGFDATKFASGTYFYKLTTGDFISVKKMILLK
jgi:Secretion system C-terminal sorting domain